MAKQSWTPAVVVAYTFRTNVNYSWEPSHFIVIPHTVHISPPGLLRVLRLESCSPCCSRRHFRHYDSYCTTGSWQAGEGVGKSTDNGDCFTGYFGDHVWASSSITCRLVVHRNVWRDRVQLCTAVNFSTLPLVHISFLRNGHRWVNCTTTFNSSPWLPKQTFHMEFYN
jgi:hypothetical protein